MDSSQWKTYGKIDAELEALLPHLPPSKSFADYKDAYELRQSIDEAIGQLVQAGLIKFPDWTGVEKKDIRIPTRDGSSIRAVLYQPENNNPGPLFIYFHGGGFVFGPPESYEKGFDVLTKQLGFTCLSIDYRMAPEHLFPTAHHDAIDSVHWAAANASSIGADLSKGFIVAGTSAGGNLAAVVTHEAIDSKLSPPITGVFLSIPTLLHWDAVPEKYKPHHQSWNEQKDAPILDQRGMCWLYATYKVDPESPLVSPLSWPSGHQSQPPTYFQVCGMDPLRDDSLIYEYVLRAECGVPTKMDVYAGIPHAGQDFIPMHSVSAKAINDLKAGIEWLQSQKP